MSDMESWLVRIDSLFEDEGFIRDLRQLSSNATLEEISPEGERPSYTYDKHQLIRNITAATMGLQALSIQGIKQPSGYENVLKQLATAWENLGKLETGKRRGKALMNAALSYELAGYQANAACLARLVEEEHGSIGGFDYEAMASVFVQRLFVRLISLSKGFVEFNEGDSHVRESLVAGLQAGAYYFLSGNDEFYDDCFRLLHETRTLFDERGLMRESNLVYGILSLLPVMREKSTWRILSKVSKLKGRWRRYLKLLARGVGQNILTSTSVSELWPSQIGALNAGLLERESNYLIKMPTSAGKTRIAELAMVHTLVTRIGSKCIYVAPYRALVYELEQTFLRLFGDLGFSVSSIVGTYEQDDFEEGLVKDSDILVMTPEKLDLVLRIEPDYLQKVKLFVLDEVQIIHDRERGAKFEILMTRIKRRIPDSRFILLSAVVAQETLTFLASWLKSNPAEDILETKWRPSVQRLARFKWIGRNGRLEYVPGEEEMFPPEFVPYIITQREYSVETPNVLAPVTKVFPEKNRKDTAAELAVKFAELGPVLIFSTRPDWAIAVAKSLKTRFDLIVNSGMKLPPYFRERQRPPSYRVASEWLGSNHIVTRMLTQGIALHHGRLPHAVRNAIESDFRAKDLRVIVATNTLAQGVNLPIRTIIVHSCKRYSGRSARMERLPARDYWNVAGRAGRPGQETTGNIVHLIFNRRDEADLQYYREHRYSIEPARSALYEILVDLVNERISIDVASEKLDPEVLALLVEEVGPFVEEEFSKKFMEDTLVKIEAEKAQVNMEKLQQAISTRAKRILRTIPDETYLPVYSSTGLSSSSCELLRAFVIENKENVKKLLEDSTIENLGDLINMFLQALIQLPEMMPSVQVNVSSAQILAAWIRGATVDQIAKSHRTKIPSAETLARYIENLFGYKLPWGIAGFIRIARKELEIEKENLSVVSKYFGSMVKSGVSTPAASWAIMSGVPFRGVAIALAKKYLDGEQGWNLPSFRKWKSRVDLIELGSELALEEDALHDVMQALSLTSDNPLLKEHSSIVDILPHETRVVGIAYDLDRIKRAHSAAPGMKVSLKRDYENQYDRNAIQVMLENQLLGYINTNLAQLAAVDIDCGIHLVGRITGVTDEVTPKVFIEIRQLP